jgi:hypothetical protein
MRGFLFVAFGKSYIDEARQSAASIRREMPGVPIAIVTNDQVDANESFDHIIPVPSNSDGKLAKIRGMIASPFTKTIFLDTDTVLLGPVNEVFDLLETHDFAATIAARYGVAAGSTHLNGVPTAFPSFNSGVIAFRKTASIDALFADWEHQFLTLTTKQVQVSLRVAIFRSNARVAPLPIAYNFRLNFPLGIRRQVKIVHGRGRRLKQILPWINRSQGIRMAVPRLYRRNLKVYGDSRWIRSIRKWFA